MSPLPLQRVLLDSPPYRDRKGSTPWDGRGSWRASWVRCAQAGPAPFVSAYRLRFRLAAPTALRCHITADERYELFLDGVRVGRGSERGDVLHWFFESYEGTLPAGEHTLIARVWSLGAKAPMAQISTAPGFLFAIEPSELSAQFDTGHAPWEARLLDGYSFQSPLAAWGTGANVVIDGEKFPWDFATSSDESWRPVEILRPANDELCNNLSITDPVLRPAPLPSMLDQVMQAGTVRHVAVAPAGQVAGIPVRGADHLAEEASAWQQLVAGRGSVTIPARTRRRVILDLENYYCAYHQVTLNGGRGAHLEIHWQESLYDTAEARTKGDRDAIEGKFYITTWHLIDGIGDRFECDGGRQRVFESLWWHCGRYVQVLVETADEPLAISSFILSETRYPIELQASFAASDNSLAPIIPLAWRTLQMCAHETFFDCPYFEQLQYTGDARLESLVTFVASGDPRLPAKAVRAFDWSRNGHGLTQSRYPSGVRQIIPAFGLFWIGMAHDYFLWRNDAGLVRDCLPGIRTVLAHWLNHLGQDGIIHHLEGWNYLDWLEEWKGGVPPEGQDGGGASFHFLLQIALRQAAELEQALGEPETAMLYQRRADELRGTTRRYYWDEKRGLFADDRAHQHFSEHAQSLAILSHAVTGTELERVTRGLLTGEGLSRATIYFTHYLFEAYREIGGVDCLIKRLDLWRKLRERGLKTTIEAPEPARSDCHAWAAHPLYHFFATVLGIRPSAAGFAQVEIAPQLGGLEWAEGTMPHPNGEIVLKVRYADASLRADITLPAGLGGEFRHAGEAYVLRPGHQTIVLAASLQQASGTR